jgi:carbon storage regulator
LEGAGSFHSHDNAGLNRECSAGGIGGFDMLVLSRKVNEGIVFNGPGRVVVIEIRGDKVRLGFQADPSTTVNRDEVAEAIAKEQNVG